MNAMTQWRLAEAKNRLSEVVRLALAEGPQRVARRDDAVIVLAEAEYRRLIGAGPSFADYLCAAPGLDALEVERDRSPMRDPAL